MGTMYLMMSLLSYRLIKSPKTPKIMYSYKQNLGLV